MVDDLYDTLGVGADATPEQIKSAYRQKAKSLHPDHCGGGSGPFRAVQEAYEVLSDPQRRQAYDCQQARERRIRRRAAPARPEPLRRRRAPVEPLVPDRGSPVPASDPYGGSLSSLLDELLEQPAGWPAAPRDSHPRGEGLRVEVELGAEEARRGGRFRLRLPVTTRCPSCRGYGALGRRVCLECRGQGVVAGEYPLLVGFPSGELDGDMATLDLGCLGLGDAHLTIRFRVPDW